MRKILILNFLSTLTYAGTVALSHNIQCPYGFTLNGKKCERIVYQPAMLNCLVGNLQGDKCVVSTEQIKQCPLGTTNENGFCVIKTIHSPLIECPHDFVMEGNKCYRKIQLNYVEQCESGRPDGKGHCVIDEIVSKVIRHVCPQGYYHEGDGCMKITEFDCSPEAPPLLVPKKVSKETPVHHQTVISAQKNAHHRLLGAKKHNYVPITVIPNQVKSKEIEVLPPPVLPSSVAVVKQLCRRQDFAPIQQEAFCPPGYVESGVNCVSQKVIPMSKRCVNGNSADSCYDIEYVQPSKHCEQGTLVNNECLKIVKIAPETVCPAGTEYMNGVCSHFTAPNLTCPAGLATQGDQCVGKEITEPQGTIETTCIGKGCFSH